MKGIVVFKGKYGATKQYAEWIGSALRIPVLPSESSQAAMLTTMDYIVLGTSVYIGKMRLRNWLRAHTGMLQHKKLFFFIVCGTRAEEKEKIDALVRSNIPEEIRNRTTIFVFPGRLTIDQLSAMDKFAIRMAAWATKDPQVKKMMKQGYDGVRRESIDPLVREVLTMMSSAKTETLPNAKPALIRKDSALN